MRFRRVLPALILCVIVSAGAVTTAQAPASVAGAEDILKPVRERFAPDRRLTVFDVTVTTSPQGVVVGGEVERPEAKDAVMRAVRAAGHADAADRITLLPDAALGARQFGIVRVSVANVRSKPSHPAEMATQTVLGWSVRVLKKQSGWYLVHTDPDGYLGWVEELQLTLVTEEELKAWTAKARVIVTAPVTVVRERAAADAAPVTDVVIGGLLSNEGTEGAWLKVSLPDGRRGYIRGEETQDFETWRAAIRPAAGNIEKTALQFVGTPYLWGGTSSKGFDCSGYVKTVLRLNGIEMPRDTDQQAEQGTAVSIDGGFDLLRKGDLLFFGTRAAAGRPDRISHVGIYVGDGEFLHASGLVRRNSLLPSSPIYSESLRNRLLRVRRILR